MLPSEIIDYIFLYENPYKNYYSRDVVSRIKKLPSYSETYRVFSYTNDEYIYKIMCLVDNKEKNLKTNVWYSDEKIPDFYNKTYSRIVLEYVKKHNSLSKYKFFRK